MSIEQSESVSSATAESSPESSTGPITRTIFAKLRDEEREGLDADVLLSELEALCGVVGGLTGARVLLPADPPSADAWDVGVLLTFESIEACHAAFGASSEADAESSAVAELLGAAVDAPAIVVKAWNFGESGDWSPEIGVRRPEGGDRGAGGDLHTE